ncbi:MAG: hypothetical protein K0U79_05150 [Gammaproteobacteria bacterium]|nr:hypothetical protein [Gammaproteobacteria bacterium]
MKDSSDQARGRRQFLLLVGLFAAPVVAALLLYFFLPGLRPESTTNYGTLVEPARPLPDKLPLTTADGLAADLEVFYGRWTLVQRTGASCDEACTERLYLTRQVRTTLNKDEERLRRILIAETPVAAERMREQLAELHPDLVILADPLEQFRAFFADRGDDVLYLLDPIGNWMMSYPQDVEPKGLQKDLKHLLRISQMG